VTAETALVLPAVVLVLALVLGVGKVVSVQLQCIDAARAAARQAARGESGEIVGAVARRFGPGGARVSVSRGNGTVDVEVSATVHLPGPGWPVAQVRGHAVAQVEQP